MENPPIDSNIRSNFKRENFNKQFQALIGNLKKSIESSSLNKDEPCLEERQLNKYMNLYSKSKPEEHYAFFENVFNQNHQDILSAQTVLESYQDKFKEQEGNTSVGTMMLESFWMCKKNVTVVFGEGVKSMSKYKDICIPLSQCLKLAIDVQITTEEQIADIDDEFIDKEMLNNTTRPMIILMHLYRIFYVLNEGIFREPLGKIVRYLEDSVGTPVHIVGSEPWMSMRSADPNAPRHFAALVKPLTGLLAAAGMPIGADLEDRIPDDNHIVGIATDMFKHPAIQNMASTAISTIRPDSNGQVNPEQMVAVLGSAIKGFANPETMRTMSESMQATAQVALKNAREEASKAQDANNGGNL